MQALTRYLYSASNIFGLSAALGVTVCFLLGVFSHFWIPFSLAAYASGALLAYAFKQQPQHIADGLPTSEALTQLRQHFMPKLPTNARKILGETLNRVDSLMPRLKEMEERGAIDAPSRAMLKQTVTRLLPDAIETYLRLPTAYANMNKLHNGKTAREVLEEQLLMLHEHVVSLEENLLSADVNSLLANGHFLQEKLQPGIKLFD